MTDRLPKISAILALNRCIEKFKRFDVGDQTWCYATPKNPIEDSEWIFEVKDSGFYKRVKVERGELPFTWLGYPYTSAEEFFKFVLADMDAKAHDMFIVSTATITDHPPRKLKQ
jgi:hypothetical protein